MGFIINPFIFSTGTTPWTPADIPTSLWLDADDASTIIEADAEGKVSTWKDSGGSNDVPQTNGSAQPSTNVNTLNGLNVITFDGSGDHFNLPVSLMSDLTGDNHFFLVLKTDDSSARQRVLRCSVSVASKILISINEYSDTDALDFQNRDSYGSNVQLPSADLANWNIIEAEKVGTTQSIATNGGTSVTNESGANTSPTEGTLGSSSSGNLSLDGDIAEVIIVSGTLSIEDKQKIEGYLAHKWGLEANLPIGHPYKSAAPTV